MRLSLEVSGVLAFCVYFAIIFLLWLRQNYLAQCRSFLFSTFIWLASFSHSHEDEALLILSPPLWHNRYLSNPYDQELNTMFMKATSVDYVIYSLLNEKSHVPVWFPFILTSYMKKMWVKECSVLSTEKYKQTLTQLIHLIDLWYAQKTSLSKSYKVRKKILKKQQNHKNVVSFEFA